MALAHAIQWYESRIAENTEIIAGAQLNQGAHDVHNASVLLASDLQAITILKKVTRETCMSDACVNMQNGMPYVARSVCLACAAPHCVSCVYTACTECGGNAWLKF